MALLVKIGADIKSFDKDLNRAINSIKPLTNKLFSIGKTLTASITLPLAGLAGISIKTAADFDSSMNQVAAISGATGDDLQALRDKAKEMGATTSKSASESAEAMSYMAMAGWSTNDMLDGLEGVLRLSEAAGTDLALTSDIVTDSLTAFGMSAKDSGKFADLLASASINANTNVEMLGESFKYCAPLFGAMGYSAEDAALALGLMANAGIKGSQAGTSLKTAITNMASPTAAMKKAMGELGISLTDSEGNMKSFKDVMGNLRDSFADLDESQQASYAATIFGKEAMSGMLAIINASEEDFIKLTEATSNYEGTATSVAETMQQGLNGQLTSLKSKLETAAIAIGEKLMPIAEAFVGCLNNMVDKFNNLSPAMQNVVLVVAGFVAALGPLLVIIASLIKLKQMWQVASTTLAIANGALSLSVLALIGWIIAIVAAIAGVIAVITYLWNTNEEFRNFIITCWSSIKEFAVAIWTAVSEFVVTSWETIKEFTIETWDAIVNFITTSWEFIKTLATSTWDMITGFINQSWEAIKSFTTTIWNAIKGVVETVWNYMSNIAKTIFNALKDFWNNWGDNIKRTFQNTWETIKNLFKSALDIISGIFNIFAGAFSGSWSQMWGGIKGVFIGIWNGIKSAFSSGINGLIGLINGFIRGVNKIKLPDWIPGVGGKGINIPLIPQVALAKGGIVTRPTVALTGEAGPEAVIPLKKLHDFIGNDDKKNGQVTQNQPSANDSMSGDLSIIIDGSVIGKVALSQLRKMQRQGNVTLIPM